MMYFKPFFDVFEFMLDSARQARLSQRAYEELSRLTDTELADLGLARSDIIRVAFGLK